MRTTSLLPIALALGLTASAVREALAEAATREEMKQVSENWLSYMVHQKGGWAGESKPRIAGVADIIASDGKTVLARRFSIAPRGFIVVPVLKELPPIKVYSEQHALDVNEPHGMSQLIREVLEHRVNLFKKKYGSLDAAQPHSGDVLFGRGHRQKWDWFLDDSDQSQAGLREDAFLPLAEVGPLLTTDWHQSSPYYDACPYGDGGQTLVGCVATASSQLMNYHQWPPNGVGNHTYYWDGDDSCGAWPSPYPGAGNVYADFSDAYDWANMPDNCDSGCSTTEQDALAELCHEVGVAYEMDYGACSSGAHTEVAAVILPRHFRYAPNIDIENRSDHTAGTWFSTIQDEINAGRPMLYGISAHAIVCDGWRDTGGENQYHMNYGWGGSQTAWFTIDDLYCTWAGCDPMVEQLVRYIQPWQPADPDCNDTTTPDYQDIWDGTSKDCNSNAIPDECDLDSATSDDCQPDNVPDECQIGDVIVPDDSVFCSPTATNGDSWCDGFEGYPVGSIQGLNGWQGWGTGSGDPAAAGNVTDEQNHTDGGTKSLKIAAHDTVHVFQGYDLNVSPFWVFSTWVYIPSTMTGTAYLIANPDYDGGAATTWSVTISMNNEAGTVHSEDSFTSLPLVTDQWAEIRMGINFEQDSVAIYYNDELLGNHAWTMGGGSLSISAIDLFSPDSSGFYHDDLSLAPSTSTDCNDNDIPDSCDIANEVSEDCQPDGVPDECQLGGGDVPVILSESFDNVGTLPASGWALINNSDPLGTAGWFQGSTDVFAAHAGDANSYAAANYNSCGDGLGLDTISNWLLLPTTTLSDGMELSFFTRTSAGSAWPDRLQVRLSSAGSSTDVGSTAEAVGDFTELLLDINPTLAVGGYPESWSQFTVPLSGLGSPTSGRLAFRYYVTDGGPNGTNSNYIGIDTVMLTDPTAVISNDCNGNSVPDECDISDGASEDCNDNGTPDDCDLEYGTSRDCNDNTIPDDCEFADCNENCVPDEQDVGNETSEDCNANSVPDECDISTGFSDDNNTNGIPDTCENLDPPGFLAQFVAREGRDTPGIEGMFTSLLATPAINNYRQIAFWADVSFSGEFYLREAICIWSGMELGLRVRESDPAPGTDGVFTRFWKAIAINDEGNVAFTADLSGSSPGGVFLSTPTDLLPVALHGDPITDPGGTVNFGPSGSRASPPVVSGGHVIFGGLITGAPGGVGESGAIYDWVGGALSVVAATGVDYPDIGVLDAIQQGPWASPGSTITFRAETAGVERILRYRDGALEEVVRRGDYAPGTASGFARFEEPVATAGPVETYFAAEAEGTPRHGLFRQGLRGDIAQLVLEGDPAPAAGAVFVYPRTIAANPLGDIYFYSQLSSGDPSAGVFKFDQRTVRASTVLLNGAPAPAAGGLDIDDVASFAINSIGDMALMYKATDGVRRILLLDQHLVGDLDLDDDVDLDDYESFVDCMDGPGISGGPLCAEADLDNDEDIDMDDFGMMQDAFIVCEQQGVDCNGNGVGDTCELEGLIATDCDGTGSLDECDIVFSTADDCNVNWLPDTCDVASGESHDFNINVIPDECEGFFDCNYNGIGDQFDLASATSEDCDEDDIPDECQLWGESPYLIGTTDDYLVRIDPTAPGSLQIIGTTNPSLSGLTASCEGMVWGLATNGDVVEIDSFFGTSNTVGGNASIVWSGAGYDCAEQFLYGSTSSSPNVDFALYTISTVDGSAEFVGDLGRSIAGLAFDSDHAKLYGLTDGNLWSIDPTTAWPVLICTNLFFSQVRSLASHNGLLYTTTYGSLHEIDPTTCQVTPLGSLPSTVNRTEGLVYTGESADCNANRVPDNCDIADGTSEDMDANGTPDECDGPDCNSSGVPDVFELTTMVTYESPQCSPFGNAYPAAYTIPASPPALSEVSFHFDVHADLAPPIDWVDVTIEGDGGNLDMINLWKTWGVSCPAETDWLDETKSPSNYNERVALAEAVMTMTATSGVDPFACPSDTFIRVKIEYLGDNDCDGNGVPDECDIAEPAVDCNGNGFPDSCDLASTRSNDCNANQTPDECEFADCNGNCVTDEEDIVGGYSLDCNANDVPDECDVVDRTSQDCDGDLVPDECEEDCQPNGIPDDCDITDSTSEDCNANGVPDECDIGETSDDCNTNMIPDDCEPDCNGNGITDECDLSSGTSQDMNGNGVPDECERAVIFVNGSATGGDNGSSWTDAYADLQDALALARAIPDIVEEIWVAAGTYTPTSRSTRTVSFDLVEGVGWYGGFLGSELLRSERNPNAHLTILSGDLNGDDGSGGGVSENSYHVIRAANISQDTILDGFVVTSGNANGEATSEGEGGGMYSYLSSPSIANCVFVDNFAESGGGMFNYVGQPMLVNSAFLSNTATQANGGGMANYGANPIVTNCTITANTAVGQGGGLSTWNGGTPTVTNSILWANTDSSGSGETAQGVNGENPAFNYNCIQGWTGAWGGSGNISSDPLFATGPLGDHYLSQIAAGQGQDSGCVDSGDPESALIEGTTRTDSVLDVSPVDIGYHYYVEE